MFKKIKNRMIYPVYGEGNVIDQTCQKMFEEIYSGNFSIIDAPCSRKTDESEEWSNQNIT